MGIILVVNLVPNVESDILLEDLNERMTSYFQPVLRG